MAQLHDPESARAAAWQRTWQEVGTSPYWSRHAPSSHLQDFGFLSYDHVRPAIEEGFEAGTSQLSTAPVRFYATTGGTTSNRPKRFPVTDAYAVQLRAISQAFAWSNARRLRGLQLGKVLTLTATNPVEHSPHGIPVGYVSWYAHHLQGPARRWISPIPDALLADDSAYQEWAPLYALTNELTQLVAVNAAKLRAFAEQIEARMDQWWPYLEGAPLPGGLPPLRVSTRRRNTLKRAFEQDPTFKAIWPRLQGAVCWKTGVSGLQLPTLAGWLGDLPVRDAPYVCTEAWLTVPLWDDHVGGVLHPSANIVEMIPVGATDTSEILQPWELTAGQDYEVLLTTTMGLIRYRVQDVVRCTGFVGRSPVLVFRHKAAFILRLGQVSIAESDVTAVLARLGTEPARTWCLGANATGDGLRLAVKGVDTERSRTEVDAELQRMRALLGPLDRALAEVLPVYGHDRSVGWMREPELYELEASHPIWKQPTHAQAKPRLLIPSWN